MKLVDLRDGTESAHRPAVGREGRRRRTRRPISLAAWGAGISLLVRSVPAEAHEVGDHANIYADTTSCLEARNHLEESHLGGGTGPHFFGKSESTAGTKVWDLIICPGIALGQPRGHLYTRIELFVYRENRWRKCLDVARQSTESGQWSLTVGVDAGKKAPCVPQSDKRRHLYYLRTHHYYVRNGEWKGGWLLSGTHRFRNA
ncbi:MAG: hypothetical protein KatS3mg008_0967 [Acidimicrobiales bacterium]|nr:MAG: hypothetical protein KatS3mg008_0967 [Acidimicrobiales bacterium]